MIFPIYICIIIVIIVVIVIIIIFIYYPGHGRVSFRTFHLSDLEIIVTHDIYRLISRTAHQFHGFSASQEGNGGWR